MKDIFQEVQVEKVSDKITDQLELLIKEGKLAPGDKLPSERELIGILGVGRSSLREALNKLETLGYVEIKKRKGIFVKSINSTLQLDPLKTMVGKDLDLLLQLYEVRGDVEQANAYAAAKRRTAKDLVDMRKCLDDFRSSQGVLHFSWERDQAFHCAVARASHNFFRIHVIMSIFNFSKEFIQPVIEELANAEDNLSVIDQQHELILKAIEDKDPDGARQEMKKHLIWTNRKFIENYQGSQNTHGS